MGLGFGEGWLGKGRAMKGTAGAPPRRCVSSGVIFLLLHKGQRAEGSVIGPRWGEEGATSGRAAISPAETEFPSLPPLQPPFAVLHRAHNF